MTRQKNAGWSGYFCLSTQNEVGWRKKSQFPSRGKIGHSLAYLKQGLPILCSPAPGSDMSIVGNLDADAVFCQGHGCRLAPAARSVS